MLLGQAINDRTNCTSRGINFTEVLDI